MILNRLGRESDEVIHDDVNRAANGVSPQVGKVKRFRPDALAGESRVAMHDYRNHFVQRFAGTVDVGPAQAVARLLGACAANGDGINGLQMARIRNEVNADFLAAGGDVSAGSSDMVFHVARTQYAARIDVFEAGDHFMGRLAGSMNHHVEAPAVAHGHDRGFRAVFAGFVEDRVQERRSEEHTSELQSLTNLVCRLLLEKKKNKPYTPGARQIADGEIRQIPPRQSATTHPKSIATEPDLALLVRGT